MLTLSYVQPYHTSLHGSNNNINLNNKFLNLYSLTRDEFFDSNEFNELNTFISNQTLESYNNNKNNNDMQHLSIRNYWEIYKQISKQLQIVETNTLETGEEISIIKTFWIKLIQRKWKKIYQLRKKERERVINRRKNHLSILHLKKHGIWPKDCNKMP
jgi:hypothetical protein